MRETAVKRMVPVLALAGIVLVPALSGCGTQPPAAAVEQSPPPVLSTSQAEEMVARYDRANNDVNVRLDAGGLAAIEAPPLRTASASWLDISQKLGQSVPLITSSDLRFVVPSDAKWFVASANRVRGGVPSPRPTWTLFSEQNGTWLSTYSLTPMQDVPPAAVSASGAATAVTDFGDLALDPAVLGQAILDHYVKDLAGKDAFAKSPALDDQLSNGYRVGQGVLSAKGRSLRRSLDPATHPMYAVRAADGGALVFSAATVIDVIKATTPGGVVTFEATTNEGALLGGTASAPQFSITRLQTYLTHIPTRTSGAQVRVLAFGDAPISVTR